MTVKELISRLQEVPENMPVYLDGIYEEVNDIFIDDMDINENETIKVLFI
jgi:hypothetical protein